MVEAESVWRLVFTSRVASHKGEGFVEVEQHSHCRLSWRILNGVLSTKPMFASSVALRVNSMQAPTKIAEGKETNSWDPGQRRLDSWISSSRSLFGYSYCATSYKLSVSWGTYDYGTWNRTNTERIIPRDHIFASRERVFRLPSMHPFTCFTLPPSSFSLPWRTRFNRMSISTRMHANTQSRFCRPSNDHGAGCTLAVPKSEAACATCNM